MDKINAIFLDFDWTIFDHKDRSFKQDADQALKIVKVDNQNIKYICNSARTYYSLKGVDAFKHVDFDAYAVCNGLAAFTKDHVIYAHYLDFKIVNKILKICEKHHISYIISTLKESYIQNFDQDINVLRYFQTFYEPYPIDINKYNKTDKILAIGLYIDQREDKYFKKFETKTRMNRFSPVCVEINACQSSKLEAINAILNYFNIPKHKSAAFGDGLNDIDMFNAVKYGICMGNGHIEAKHAAKFVTSDIDNHGIEIGLKYLQLLK